MLGFMDPNDIRVAIVPVSNGYVVTSGAESSIAFDLKDALLIVEEEIKKGEKKLVEAKKRRAEMEKFHENPAMAGFDAVAQGLGIDPAKLKATLGSQLRDLASGESWKDGGDVSDEVGGSD